MNEEKIVEGLHPLERKVLPAIERSKSYKELIEKTGLKDIEVMRAIQWLQNKKIIDIKVDEKNVVDVDDNGKLYQKLGLPERRFLKALENAALSLDEIQKKAKLNMQEVSVCIGLLKQKAAVSFIAGKIALTEQGKKLLQKETLEEIFLKRISSAIPLDNLSPEEKFAFEALRKRKNIIKIDLVKIRTIKLTELGKKVSKIKIKEGQFIDRLSPEMLKSGGCENKSFRRYDVKINVPKIYGGKRHFVNQAVAYIKKIWLELGFKEMQGNLLQTSFWDLDALFVPQDHPARTMQDTFYIKEPRFGKLPSDFARKIKAVHENGADTGSLGWQSAWKDEIAKENLLRTHTTVLSAHAIHALKKEQLPAKFFSVGKVFRNEALDWKHLFELNQVEGIVVDPDVNLKHLKGYLKEFFTKMGYKDVRIRPAHFPYTEPSAEIEVLHPVKKQWVEFGGAGIFRPEVVKPLLGIEVPVLAWGFGMERIIAEYFDIQDIRDLYANDLKQIREMKSWMRF